MSLIPEKYVRKPVVVEAVQVTEENFFEVAMWCNGDVQMDGTGGSKFIRVRVHSPQSERQKQAYIDDWVLYSRHGYKIYTNKAFQNTFDLEPSRELKQAWEEFKKEAAAVFKPMLAPEVTQVAKPEKRHFRGGGNGVQALAICENCGAPKGVAHIGDMCNNNCGGRVIANPQLQSQR